MSLFKRERLSEIEAAAVAAPVHRVLIVDDEEGNLRVLRSMLADRFQVLEASDGRRAMELLQALGPGESPCVILSDQRMPRMTGVELFEQVRELMPAAIRIIITGFVDVGAIVDAINRAGIYKFVVKPFDRHDLLLTVERAVEAFEMRRQIDRHIEELEAKVKERTRELEQKHQALLGAFAEIERLSLTDTLTGLGNRRYLDRAMRADGDGGQSAERRQSSGQRTAFLLVDIDHFKSINDQHGHAAGDAVLAAMGNLLREHCRDGDLAVRWGGEEFLLRLAVDGEPQALLAADRLRAAVAAARFDIGDGVQLQRSCSIGIACLPFDPAAPDRFCWEQVLAIADHALYLAKRGGRNAVVCLSCAGPLPDDFTNNLAEHLPLHLANGALRELRPDR